jgi:ureidoacrylate peracid hydrolase
MPYVTKETLESKTREWLRAIGPFNRHELTLNPETAALLVIDMQNFFVDPEGGEFVPETQVILPEVKRLIGAFRGRGRPVIFTSHVHTREDLDGGLLSWWWTNMCMEGTEGAQIHPEIAPRDDEKVIKKHRYSAFYNTDLETVLRCLGIEDLVITGVMTNICVDSTTRDAFFRDHRSFIPVDGTAGSFEELHVSALSNLAFGFAYVTDINDLLRQVGGTG